MQKAYAIFLLKNSLSREASKCFNFQREIQAGIMLQGKFLIP